MNRNPFFQSFLITVAILQLGFLNAQKVTENKISNKSTSTTTFNFEDQEKDWQKDEKSYFNVTSEKAASGEFALKFNIPDENVFLQQALYSIETGHTIQKVRTAKFSGKDFIIASSYEGIVIAVDFDGAILWKNKLSGYMAHDIWCADITGDSNDEILIANADGVVYCIDYKGKLLWKFQKNEVPMYAVCVVTQENTPYVVCGGFDLNVYYLNADGTLKKTLKSSTYSKETTWGDNASPSNLHYSNFLRPIKKADGTDMLAIQASNNHMQDKGATYLFDVLGDVPLKRVETEGPSPIGEFRTSDFDKDGIQEILLGASSHHNDMAITRLNPKDDSSIVYKFEKLGFGYSVGQAELIDDGGIDKYMILIGNQIVLLSADLSANSEEKLATKYAYYDMWKQPETNTIILASSQSGGSCIHVFNTENLGWKKAYSELIPPGKIQKILKNTADIRTNLASYTMSVDQRPTEPVYLMSENIDSGIANSVYKNIVENYSSPIFLGGSHMGTAENWDRSSMANEKYKNKRDGRRDYVMTQQEAVSKITGWYGENEGYAGISYWGGHGNDPYMFQLSTTKKVLDFANGKKTVLIYPELEDHSDDFAWVLNDLFYPLAAYAKTRNANIFVRTKHNFWYGNAYLPMWNGLMSGKYANVFVPAMEETSDKMMEINVASRSGIWASGAINNWGTRVVPDNASFDRSRQFSNQQLPNHFLRNLVYHVASGATYLDNFAVDQEYMSIVWELIAKGALFVPKSNEIVSYSPIHLSMKEPDEHFIDEGSSVKWSTFYNEEYENSNSFVFGRQNATWLAAKVTKWDFSRYAAGVKDRRQNFLPNYSNGMVLITPPQAGKFADPTATRGALKNNLHPLYKNILKEYYTDGRNYYSADGNQTLPANTYYSTIENDLKEKSKLIPLTISGEVAWVVAQTSPTNLRLTIVDGGYLNPNDRTAVITFNTVSPIEMKDILDKTSFNIGNPKSVIVDIPCGAFRFIDIKLSQPLN